MTPADLRTVLDWAAAEGWNPGLDDADAFFAADRDGFFVAEADGTLAAAISVVAHNPDFAFLGLYITQPTRRGQGIGHALWRHAIAHAGDRTIGLDGVPDQQANYERSGFRRAGETVRYIGPVPPDPSAAIRPARPGDVAQLVALEGAASGWVKPDYLAAWFARTPTRRTYIHETEGRIVGAVTIRDCAEGAKIGPLIAPDRRVAMGLLRHAVSDRNAPVSIDIPQAAEAFGADCAALGLVPGFRTARMYRGPAATPAADGPGLFAVTTLELG